MEHAKKTDLYDICAQIAPEKKDTRITLVVQKSLLNMVTDSAAKLNISVNEFAIKAFCKALAE